MYLLASSASRTVTATFAVANGRYEGVYQRPNFKKAENDEHDRIDRAYLLKCTDASWLVDPRFACADGRFGPPGAAGIPAVCELSEPVQPCDNHPVHDRGTALDCAEGV